MPLEFEIYATDDDFLKGTFHYGSVPGKCPPDQAQFRCCRYGGLIVPPNFTPQVYTVPKGKFMLILIFRRSIPTLVRGLRGFIEISSTSNGKAALQNCISEL